MAVEILHQSTDRAILTQAVDVTFGGTYPTASFPEAVDVVAQARADALATLGPGNWAIKFDLALDDPNKQWVVTATAVMQP